MFYDRFRKIVVDYGLFGGMTSYTAVMPIVGSTLMLGSMYSISPWLQANWEIGVVLVVFILTALSGLALVAINILGVVSGFAFQFPVGLAAYLTGIVGAATVMFFLAKRLASGGTLALVEKKPKLNAVRRALIDESAFRTFLILVLIRLSPAIPFAATNFVVSASGISYKTFFLATVVGMLPRASAVVFVGSSLSELNFSEPQESWLVIVGIAATVFAVVLIGVVARRTVHSLAAANLHRTAE